MATDTSWKTQIERKEADGKGHPRRFFRWGKLRFEWARVCYIVHPIQGVRDYTWIEWEKP